MIKTFLKNLKGRIFTNKPFSILVFIIVIVALASSLYFYNQYRISQNLLQNPDQQSAAEVKQLLKKIGKIIELPKGETPTIATVSDVTKLADQPFFAKAQNGDKVLIYSKAQKAILYRPSINKIIEVAPVNLGNTQATNPLVSQSPVASPSIAQSVKVVIYNGTKISGLAKKEGDSLKIKYPNLEIVSTANATGDYTQDLVVDLTGQNSEMVKTLATELSGKVGSLPSGEVKPTNADILIILGQ